MKSLPEVTNLLESIRLIDKISDEEWQSFLNERKRKELVFHDRDRDSRKIEEARATDTYERFYGNKKYYAATRRSGEYMKNWIARECKDKIFLDYACGNGGNALYAATQGAALSLGFDISGVSVQNAKRIAEEQGVAANTRFFQADAENTKLPENSIDVISCTGMLHHLDLSCSFPELRRILKKNGKILVVEALDYNPAIKLYRWLTPDMRTEWEKTHILNLSDIRFASRFFAVEEVRFWHICGYVSGKFPFLFPFLDPLDRVLERIPYVQRMAWIFTFVLRKRAD